VASADSYMLLFEENDRAGIAWSAKVNRQDQLSEQPEPLLEK